MGKIYEYSDYRRYLKDFYQSNKAFSPSFSYLMLSQKAGINSPSFFKSVMEGKRNLTDNTIARACLAFDLKGKEAEYFKTLVHFNQAKSIRKKNEYFDDLIRMQKYVKVYHIEESQYEYFSHWYHCAIRELVVQDSFDGDFKKLAHKLNPPILPRQAESSVRRLLKLGFLEKREGKYIQSQPTVSTGHGINRHQIINFQIAMLNKAIEAYENCRNEDRLTSSVTVALSRTAFQETVRSIRQFQRELLQRLEQEKQAECAYQININLFPLSKWEEGK